MTSIESLTEASTADILAHLADPGSNKTATEYVAGKRIAALESKIREWEAWCDAIYMDFEGVIRNDALHSWDWIDDYRSPPGAMDDMVQ